MVGEFWSFIANGCESYMIYKILKILNTAETKGDGFIIIIIIIIGLRSVSASEDVIGDPKYRLSLSINPFSTSENSRCTCKQQRDLTC